MKKACTQYWIDLAMKITLKDIRLPKCVRDGKVKLTTKEINHQSIIKCTYNT